MCLALRWALMKSWVSWRTDRRRAQRGGTSSLMKDSWEEWSKETYLCETKGKRKKKSGAVEKEEENHTDRSSWNASKYQACKTHCQLPLGEVILGNHCLNPWANLKEDRQNFTLKTELKLNLPLGTFHHTQESFPLPPPGAPRFSTGGLVATDDLVPLFIY